MSKTDSRTAFGLAAESTRRALRFDPQAEDSTTDLEEDRQGEEEVSHDNGDTEARVQALEHQQALQSLLADEDIQKVLEARKKGVKLKVETVEEREDEIEPEEDFKDLKEDDPLKPVLTRISQLVDKKNTNLLKQLGLDKITSRLEGVEALASVIQKKEVDEQVKKAKEKHKDLGEYGKEIIELAKAHPGLNVEELYILSKHKAGKLKLSEPTTFSERPSNQPARRGREGKPKAPEHAPGRRGFSDLLKDSLKSLTLEEVSEE